MGHVGRDSANDSTLNASLKPFVTKWGRDSPWMCARHKMVSLKVWPRCIVGIVELFPHPLGGPYFEMLHCSKSDLRLPLPTFLHLFFFPFPFLHPWSLELAVMATICASDRWWCRGWWWLSWQREAGAEEDVRRVRRRWEAGSCPLGGAVSERNRCRRAVDFFELCSLASSRRPTKFGSHSEVIHKVKRR